MPDYLVKEFCRAADCKEYHYANCASAKEQGQRATSLGPDQRSGTYVCSAHDPKREHERLRSAVVEAAQRWRRAQGEALNVMEVDGMRPVVTRTWYLLRRTVEDLNEFEASLKDQEHASK